MILTQRQKVRIAPDALEEVAETTLVTVLPPRTEADVSFPERNMSPLAQALLTQALDQAEAVVSAEVEQRLPQQRAEVPVSLAIVRANATQAQRTTDCLRTCLETLMEHLAQPCCVLTVEGQVLRTNPAFVAWSGLATEQLLGRTFPSLFSLKEQERVCTTLHSLIADSHFPFKRTPSVSLTLSGPLALITGPDAVSLTLLSQERIPGVLEAILVLFTVAP